MKALTKRTILVLMLLALLTVTSVVLMSCGGGGDIELAAPQNITYDGAVIRWDAVEGAEGYYITVGGQEWNITDPLYPHSTTESAEFSVSIKAWTTDKRDETVMGDATTVNFKPLATITDLTVTADGTLTWTPVDFATSYEVRVDGKDVVKTSVCELLDVKEGQHNYAVRPVVDAVGGTLYYSRWSVAKSVNKLATVKVDKITYKDGEINWNQVNGASSYQVIIDGVEVASENVGTRYLYDAENQNFEVQIRANGNGTSTYNGKVCDVKKFVYLAPVTGIRVVDGTLYWDAVGGADGYTVRVNGTDKAVGNNCAYTDLVAGINNRVSIIPTSTDSVYFSSWTPEQNVKILARPVLQWNNEYALDGQANANCFWNGVDGAGGYVIKLTKPDGSSTEIPYGETQRSFAEAYLDAGVYLVELQAVPSSTTTDVYPSAYSKAIEVVRLASPKKADQAFIVSDAEKLSSGFTANFQSVQSAHTYELYMDGGRMILSQNSPMFRVPTTSFIDATATQEMGYNFYVRARGNSNFTNGKVVLDSLTDGATSFEVRVLATPQNMTMNGFLLTYGEVNGCSGYNVAVNSSAQGMHSSSTVFDLGAVLQAGSYSVSVCAKGNNSNILASNFSPALTVVRLEAPTGIRIGTQAQEEGKLIYNTVAHAAGYNVVFNNDAENAVPVSELNNINQRITVTGTTVYMTATANTFVSGIYYMTSKGSETMNFIKLTAPTWAEVKTNGNQLVWITPSNAQTQSFIPNYRVADNSGTVYSGQLTGNTMNLATLTGGQNYTFKVQAIGDGTKFINSDYSDPITLYKLETPTLSITATRDAFSFDAVARATSYQVWIDGVKAFEWVHEPGKTYTFKPDIQKLGSFTVEVYAIGDGGITLIDATPAHRTQKTQQLELPEFEFSYSHPDGFNTQGEIIVNVTKPSPYALGYIFHVGGTSHVEYGVTSFRFNPNGSGKFKVGITAIGGGFNEFDDEENSIYYIESLKVGDNDRNVMQILDSINPTDIQIDFDGILFWEHPVEGAQGYIIDLVVNGETIPTIDVGANVTQINLKHYGIQYQAGNMNVSICIKAKGNGNHVITSAETVTSWPR